MFLTTHDFIPVATHLGITICFDSEADKKNLSISAKGQVVRSERDGVGIRFTSININRFRKCVIEKINTTHASDLQTIKLDDLAVWQKSKENILIVNFDGLKSANIKSLVLVVQPLYQGFFDEH